MIQKLTKEERRIVKIKYNRFKRRNPKGFTSSSQRFRIELADKFSNVFQSQL